MRTSAVVAACELLQLSRRARQSSHGVVVFSAAEIEQFVEDGYVVLREAFSPQLAAEIRERLWNELGLDPAAPSMWTQPVIQLQKVFSDPPFSSAWSERAARALDQLLGAGRYHMPRALGWFPVAFPGFHAPPWRPPEQGWHVDGIHFHHHVYSRDQGLLPIVILSDIEPGDGGTAIDVGSHKLAARILADAEPEGLALGELGRRLALEPFTRVVEATGRAGDIFLHHPFMRHARSPNTGQRVRFICNPCIALKEHMNLSRSDESEYSPVELAIVRALGNRSAAAQ